MENLTKQQIVLLTLLVSFVTSIATGIVTVSLLDQAPAGVTQTINRVVEKTIERVVPVPTQSTATVIQKETGVVKEDDQTVGSIEKNSKSLVRIYQEGTTESNPEPHAIFQSLGFVVSKDGIVATDAFPSTEGTISLVFSDGKSFPAKVIQASGSAVTFLKAVKADKDEYAFVPVTLGNSNTVKLGQTVIAFSGKDKNSVSMGIISSLREASVKESQSTSTPVTAASIIILIETTVSPKDPSIGGPLVNLTGDVVGIKLAQNENEGRGAYTPIASLKQALLQIQAKPQASTTTEKKI